MGLLYSNSGIAKKHPIFPAEFASGWDFKDKNNSHS
jgi:hypothetical protein